MFALFHKGAGAKIPDELVVEFGVEGEVKALDSFSSSKEALLRRRESFLLSLLSISS